MCSWTTTAAILISSVVSTRYLLPRRAQRRRTHEAFHTSRAKCACISGSTLTAGVNAEGFRARFWMCPWRSAQVLQIRVLHLPVSLKAQVAAAAAAAKKQRANNAAARRLLNLGVGGFRARTSRVYQVSSALCCIAFVPSLLHGHLTAHTSILYVVNISETRITTGSTFRGDISNTECQLNSSHRLLIGRGVASAGNARRAGLFTL